MNTVLTTLDGARTAMYTRAGHWRDTTIFHETVAHARATPDKVAIREADRTATFAELVAAADRLAFTWAQHGLRPGDRVAVWLPSRIEVAVAVLACSRNGYIASPSLHRDHTVDEILELVTRMRAAAVVAQPGYGADADRHSLFDALDGAEHIRHRLALPPASEVGTPFTGLDPIDSDARPTARTDPNTVVYLAFTSGTTGQPKGVMHSDNTLLAPARALSGDWALDGESIIYSLSPLSHNLGFGAMLLALTIGAEFVVHDLPRRASLAERLRETGATFAFGVPTHAIDLLAELRAAPDAGLPELRGFRISGAAVPPSVAQGLLDIGVIPQSGYGMTEAGSHHYTLPTDSPDLIVGSSGRACAGYEIRIVSRDDPERELPTGEVGQIAARGASLMLGYFDDQIATESSFSRSGWFLTGDLGWQDEAGYLRITGRKKDVIIRGGHNIFPAKIENLAMRYPDVAKAAVVPVADARLGEKVCLVVQPRHDTVPEPEALLAHLDEAGLSRYDMPEYFAITQELPLMPSGKILKRRLLEWIDERRIVPAAVRFTPAASHR